MIPLKLHLKNFVSYGSTTQVIDLEPYKLICLSGKNGHGKSAMLDALTWVIWGHARKATGTIKADEGLLRLGQTHMMVSLDFLCNNQQYRIRREYTHATHKALAELSFGIVDSASGFFRSLTDKTIRATQEKIELTVGLDFESFINSAFLRQGQSNEFSKKSPRDRKEVLASILGLDHYERIRKRACERSKDASSEKERVEKSYELVVLELKQKNTNKYQLQELQQALQALLDNEANMRKKVQYIKHQQLQATNARKLYDRTIYKLEQVDAHFKQRLTEVKQQLEQWRSIGKRQASFHAHGQLEAESASLSLKLQEIRAAATAQIQLKEQFLAFKEQENKYMQQVTQAFQQEVDRFTLHNQQLRLTISSIEQRLSELTNQKLKQQSDIQKLTNELTNLTATLPSCKDLLQTLELQEKQFEKRKAYYHKFLAQATMINNELTSLEQKKELAIKSEDSQCPLCEQGLSSDRKQAILSKFTQQEWLYSHQLARLSRGSKYLKNILYDQHKFLEENKKQIELATITQVKIDELLKQLTLSNAQQHDLSAALEDTKKQLALQKLTLEQLTKDQDAFLLKQKDAHKQDTHYQAILTGMQTCEKEIHELGQQLHYEKELTQRLDSIVNAQKEQLYLVKEIALQDQRKQAIKQECEALKKLKQEKKLLEQEITSTSSCIAEEQLLMQEEHNLSLSLQLLVKERETYILQKGALEQQLKTIEQKELESGKQKIVIAQLDQLAEEYQVIANALSKDGIQALLIDDALPEIEHEANNLLSRLTDNQAHISIESLRDLRGGGTKETLEIKISDSIGIRPYELFSGGEAFRIDFALRIAISKLLARRAGTSLQTLIIDEGFGSQDEEGLAHIMEALHKIQDDFAKVIVVSHLSSLKEQFPVHFFVHKGPEGSCIKVMEQG